KPQPAAEPPKGDRTPTENVLMSQEQREWLNSMDPPNFNPNPPKPQELPKLKWEQWEALTKSQEAQGPIYTEEGPFPEKIQKLVDDVLSLNVIEMFMFFKAASIKLEMPF